MPYPKAGWLAVRERTAPMVFTPHPRIQRKDYPSFLTMMLGTRMKKKIRIQSPASGPSSPRFLPVRLIQTARGEVKAGPFVAILTSSSPDGFRGNRQNFIDLILTGHQMGVTVFILTPEGVRSGSSGSVRGWLLDTRNRKKRWLSATLPMPDVVYNRIPTRRIEQRHVEREVLRQFISSPRIHLFNPGFFDKWTISLYLQRSPNFRKMLPETEQWGDIHSFREMLEKHETLYLKPADGKAGDGMIRVTREKDAFEIVHQTAAKNQRIRVSSRQELFRRLTSLTHSQRYVLQQGIPLARYRQRPFDLRLLLQKDGTGRWSRTGIGIRLAGQDAISTHVPRGGSIENPLSVMQDTFGDRAGERIKQIGETGIRLAAYIEQQYGHNLGEMSMDMGIDRSGRLWFFEANAKPMKFDEPDIRERSLKKLIHYFLYLSGFHPLHRREGIKA
ncbi:YheC/YheD family endospore coat-associated protein [Paludifilum halophilum]|uniref:ATP-grasp domain-containing protein n=1 Tax=Paludifilum halophilum TaxID=1642702 RepID=A0A235B7Z7_9BACL|nr:YheC/YheD family protein [Paludifilum halophilum]OYD08438.1 hypothetical protein CHM34_06285 [Paludifilum halophilum]